MASVSECEFGNSNGIPVKQFTIRNAAGDFIQVLSYGATLRSWCVAGIDVVLGFDTLSEYEGRVGYLGQTVGRVCNRIRRGAFRLCGRDLSLATNNGPNHLHGGIKGFSHTLGGSLGKTIGRVCNRIGGGRLRVGGKETQLPLNKPPHHCHGGKANFSTKVWSATVVSERAVRFACESPDGEEGYPGAVSAAVTYSLGDNGELRLDYEATVAGSPTPLNLTNHAYFNLAGHANGSVRDHVLTVYADEYLPTDKDCLVTGEIVKVDGSAWDLREGAALGPRIDATGGYDNNFCVRGADGKSLRPAAKLECGATGLVLETETTKPGLQVYTANSLNHTGKGGASYPKYSSICLETQGYPDAVNHDTFPSVIVSPGETYKHTTIYRLSKK